VQFFRLDQPFMFGLSQAQLLAFLMGAIAVWVLVYMAASARRSPRATDDVDDLDDDLAEETNAVASARPVRAGSAGTARRPDQESS
jgi:hypothetical protein